MSKAHDCYQTLVKYDLVKYVKFLHSYDEVAQKLIDISKLENRVGKTGYMLHSRNTCFNSKGRFPYFSRTKHTLNSAFHIKKQN